MAGALDYFNANRRQSLDDTQGLFDQQTMRQAGGLLAGGDYTGAAGALYGGGLLSQGAVVQKMGEDRAAASSKAGKEAKDEAAKVEAAEQLERLKFFKQAGTVLLSIPQANRAQAYTSSIAPALKAMGADDSMIAQAGSDLSDAALQTFTGEVDKSLEQFTLSPGSARYDSTGKVIASQPFAPEYKSVSPGETLVEVGGGGVAAPSGSAPRNERNNNPGNIEDGDFARSLPGYKGSDGRFAIFDTAEAGANAQTALLQSYGKRGFDTVGEIINRWAPPSDNNPTSAYADFVAKKLGVGVNDPLNMSSPETLRALAGAIKQFEGGGQSASNGSSGARVIAQGAPKPDMTPAQHRKAEADLRKEFNGLPDVKEFNDVANSYNTISRLAAAKPSGPGDISFIFSYMKMLDPGSVVREGEYATAANSGGVPAVVTGLYNRVINGERLTPKQRQDFVTQARNVYESRKTRYDQLIGQYQGYAEDYGLRPDVIQPRVAVNPTPTQPGGRPEGWTKGIPEAQRKAAMRFQGATGKGGTDANPFLPASEAEYKALKPGAVYIHPDGSIRTKGGN